jgi:hypothetical protein
MTVAPAEVRVGVTSESGLLFGHRLDHEFGLRKEFVKASADDRISLAVQNNAALEVAGSRQSSHARVGDRVSVGRRVVLGSDDRDQSRRIDDHDGRPRSS